MKHHKIQNQLSAYLDNELKPEARRIVEKHLIDCQECKEMLEDFQHNRQQISDLIHPAPSMKNTVLAMIHEAETTKRKGLLSGHKTMGISAIHCWRNCIFNYLFNHCFILCESFT